jgi:AraC-like DNA-binding protein
VLEVLRVQPSPHLAPVVRLFESRLGILRHEVAVRPLAARPEQFLEFYLGDPYRVRSEQGLVRPAPGVVVVGVHTRRGDDLLLSGSLRVLTVQFTPTGFHALFGVPQHLMTDLAVPASDLILPREIDSLAAMIGEIGTFEGGVALVETWLTRRLSQLNHSLRDPITEASRHMAQSGGRMRIDRLVSLSGLSARQFERRFQTQVGVGPKRYARILRFSRALRLRYANPRMSWTEIAHDAGFTDQAHMIHEFHALSGEKPQAMITALGDALE